jgi:hypothetical protein
MTTTKPQLKRKSHADLQQAQFDSFMLEVEHKLDEPLSGRCFLIGCAIIAEAIYTAGRGGHTSSADTNLPELFNRSKKCFL